MKPLKKETKVHQSVLLDADLRQQVVEICTTSGKSLFQLISEALSSYLKTEGRQFSGRNNMQ